MQEGQVIHRGSQQRQTAQVMTTGLVVILVIGVVVGLIIAGGVRVAVRQLDPEQRDIYLTQQWSMLPWKLASGKALMVGGWLFVGSVLIGLVYGGWIGLQWLKLRSNLVYFRDGLAPVIRVSDGAYYDPNRDNLGADPIITVGALSVQKEAARRADQIIVKDNGGTVLPQGMEMPQLQDKALPGLVLLSEVAKSPSLERLTVGVGERGPVTTSLYDMMHVLAVGASGFGKSAFLRAMVWQLAQVQEPVDVVAIDINGSEFNMIQQWSRLLYPVARDTETAAATLRAVTSEIERRKGLYEAIPTAYDLPSYNRQAERPLSPVVILTDEGTNLLNQPGIGEPLRETVQTARQYGVYLLLAGQSVTANVIPTQTRDNFYTRLCFHTSPSSRRVVLGESVDDVTEKGRAWALLAGQMLQQVQVPYVSRDELRQVIEVGHPQRTIEVEAVETTDAQEQVWGLHADGFSDTAIAREVFGHGNPFYIGKVREILQQQQQ